MDLQKFSVFKYQHKGRGGISAQRWRAIKLTLGIALLAAAIFFPVGAVAFLLPLVAYATAPKMLYIGPRYLICGDAIVYFNNVSAMARDESAGTLRLVSANERGFVLERDKFPTNARKEHKIAANKAGKFAKASAKLIDKVLKASPQVELSGITRAASQE